MHKVMLASFLFFLVTFATIAGSEAKALPIRNYSVRNVQFRSSSGHVTVSYDLDGPVSSFYNVRLLLRQTDDTTFEYIPKRVSGDVGIGKFAGKHDRIYWDIGSELPGELQGNDYYFIVDAAKIPEHGSVTAWLSAAVIAAAAAIVYLIRP